MPLASRPSRHPTPGASRPCCATARVDCLQRAERRPPGDLVVAWSDALYPDQLRDLRRPAALPVRARRKRDGHRADEAVRDRRRAARRRRRARARRRPTARTWRASSPATWHAPASWSSAAWPWASTRSRRTAAVDGGSVPREPGRPCAVLGCGADVRLPAPQRPPLRAGRRDGPHRQRVHLGRAGASVAVPGAEPRHGRARRGRSCWWRAPSAAARRITAEFGVELGREVLCVPGEAGRRLSEAPQPSAAGRGAGSARARRTCSGAIAVDDPGPGRGRVASCGPASLPVLVLDHGGAAVRDVLHAAGGRAAHHRPAGRPLRASRSPRSRRPSATLRWRGWRGAWREAGTGCSGVEARAQAGRSSARR